MIKKLKYKRLMNNYRALKTELEFAREVSKYYSPEFETYYRQYCSKNDIDIDKLNREHAAKVSSIFSESKKKKSNTDPSSPNYNVKNIFKELARKFHPDKIPYDDPLKAEYEEIFKSVTAAMDDCDWGKLLGIADEHEIELKDYDSLCASLQLSIDSACKKIEKEKSSYSWALFMCEGSEECMDEVVKKFLNHLFDI